MSISYNIQKDAVVINVKLPCGSGWHIRQNGINVYSSYLPAELKLSFPINSEKDLSGRVDKYLYGVDISGALVYQDGYALHMYWEPEDEVTIQFIDNYAYEEIESTLSRLKETINEINKEVKANQILQNLVDDISRYNITKENLFNVLKEVWDRAQSPYWEHEDWATLEKEENME